MNEFRAWWGSAVRAVVETVGAVFGRLADDIMHRWPMSYILLAGCLAVILGMIYLWKHRA